MFSVPDTVLAAAGGNARESLSYIKIQGSRALHKNYRKEPIGSEQKLQPVGPQWCMWSFCFIITFKGTYSVNHLQIYGHFV